MDFENNISFDSEQLKVIYSNLNSNLLVIAPPGAGKTTVMAKRIEYILNNNLLPKPYKILGLTFSNIAAKNMKKKIQNRHIENRVYVTTFHSFAFSTLNAYGQCIGIKNGFRIISDYEKDKIINGLIKKTFLSALKALNNRDRAKEEDRLYKEYKKWAIETILKCSDYGCEEHSSFVNILDKYREILSENNLIDHDHTIYYTNKIFEEYPNILSYFASTFRYIVIDEFQDTNMLQYKILEKILNLNKQKSHILILADPKQAIYSFQGATPKNIEKFKENHDCDEIFFKKNHRISSNQILNLLKNLSLKFDDINHSDISKSDEIFLALFKDEFNEQKYIIYCINELIQKDIPLHEIAILAPSGYAFGDLSSKLKENGLDSIYIPKMSKNNILKKYDSLFNLLLNYSESNDSLENIMGKVSRNFPEDDMIVNLLISISKKYDTENYRNLTMSEKIKNFYNDFVLNIDIEELLQKKFKNKIFMSTIHGVKGLEFDNVIIIGLNEGVIPHYTVCSQCRGSKNIDSSLLYDSLNLLNVAISRAKKKLYLVGTYTRNGFRKHGTCLLEGCVEFKGLQFKNE